MSRMSPEHAVHPVSGTVVTSMAVSCLEADMIRNRFRFASISTALLLFSLSPAIAAAQTTPAVPRFSALVEGASLWLARNDIRIPPDTGTEFSIVDLIGTGPTAAGRVEVTTGLASRHELRFVYAPIEISGTGVPPEAIAFAGQVFAPGVATEADYQFTSYRGTYRYTFYAGDRWQWQIGFTGFVRDARIALRQAGVSAEDTDAGSFPSLTCVAVPRWVHASGSRSKPTGSRLRRAARSTSPQCSTSMSRRGGSSEAGTGR